MRTRLTVGWFLLDMSISLVPERVTHNTTCHAHSQESSDVLATMQNGGQLSAKLPSSGVQ